MIKRVALIVSLLIGCLPLLMAQKKVINSDWQFQRLDGFRPQAQIRNQGSSWSSQYNVEHVTAQSNELSLHADTLKSEFTALASGNWEQVSLPHTPFVEDLTVLHQWQGVCYYRRVIEIAPSEESMQLWIEFEGAMHLADVWINGRHVMQHAGGYLPFVVDATGMLSAHKRNEIVVRLDNRNNPLVPPGKPLESLDFCYYGGLYRDVNLISKPAVHITHPILADKKAGGGIFVTYPEVSDAKAVVEIKTEVANKTSDDKKLTVRHTLYQWTKAKGIGRKVLAHTDNLTVDANSAKTHKGQITVEKPRLWSPDSPALYVLETQIVDAGKVIDQEQTRIGIRRLEITREQGFLINGKPLKLVGSNRHMEYPYVGNAISDNAQYRDMYDIRMNGFNVVRLGHYPQDVSVLDACDELGLLAIEPIPGWQFFNNNPKFITATYRDTREMIRRDRNHPSVIMWETTLNESWPPAWWKDSVVIAAHEEYPTDQCFTSGDAYGYEGFDVCYNDWAEGFQRPNKTSKPGFIREYYDYEFGGHYSTTRIGRGDGERALQQNAWNAQWSYNRYNAQYPSTIGSAVWSMYDYNRGCCDNICRSGVSDLFRLPKFSVPFFRTQIAAGTPLPGGRMAYEVFVASTWLEHSSDTVQVYGNVEQVELFVNGRSIGRRKADNGPDTDYVAGADGGNCRNLSFPPFTFNGVQWESGDIQAVGYVGGKIVARHSVRTPAATHRMSISYFESGRAASTDDLLIVYVRIEDAQGALLRGENSRKVSLIVHGGQVVGPSQICAQAGVASFLVRTETGSKLSIDAVSGDMNAKRSIALIQAE